MGFIFPVFINISLPPIYLFTVTLSLDGLFCNSVKEEVEFGPRALKFPQTSLPGLVSETLDALSIENLIEDAPLSLSNGQRLRVATASIASMRPEVFLLDEPTQGQDRVNIESLMNCLKIKSSQGAAVLFILRVFFP